MAVSNRNRRAVRAGAVTTANHHAWSIQGGLPAQTDERHHVPPIGQGEVADLRGTEFREQPDVVR